MDRIKLYLRETYNELMYKVTWPTWKELSSSAVVVLVACLIISVIILAMDQASSFVIRDILYEFLIPG